MKHSKRLTLLLAIIFTCALVCATLYGCIDIPTYPLTELSWVTTPKTLYFVGDEFDPGEALIQATYDNDPTRRKVLPLKDIPQQEYTLTGFTTAERAMQGIEVTLTYQNIELKFTIKVIEQSDLKTLTFMPMNGEDAFTQSVVVGDVAVKPTDPKKPNLVLEAWILENNEVFDFKTAVQDDMTLSARYAAAYEFFIGGATPFKTVLTTEGQDFDPTKLPELNPKAGYTAYWCFNDTGKPVSKLTVDEMKRLKTVDQFYENLVKGMRFDAIYIPETYTVQVDIMGGSFEDVAVTSISVPHGYTIAQYFPDYNILKDNVFKADNGVLFTFGGWYYRDNSGFTQEVNLETTPIEGNATIYARWQYAVIFLSANVFVDQLDGSEFLRVRNDYDQLDPFSVRYHKVMVDDGKAPTADQIPAGTSIATPGYQRWWSNQDPAFQPGDAGAIYLKDVVSTDTITSTVGSPSTHALMYFEVYYQTKYRVKFDAQDGTVIGGMPTMVEGLTYGKRIESSQVPTSEHILYTKDGVVLNFYNWYYDDAYLVEFSYPDYRVNDQYVVFAQEGNAYIGTLTLKADYVAQITWVNDFAADGDSKGGEVPPENARLSKNNVTRASLPALPTSNSHDYDWYVMGSDETAFPSDVNGKILKFTQTTIYVKQTPKEYNMQFESVVPYEGGAQAVPVPGGNQRVNYGEPFELPAQYFHYEDPTQIQGYRDPTGKWQIEGYYKNKTFDVRYSFEQKTLPDGSSITVSKETFVSDTVVYVRWVRVGTEGLSFIPYVLDSYHVSYTPELSTLAEIVVPETYKGMPVIGIDVNAFENFAISNIILPKGIVDVRDNAFNGCTNLLTLPQFDPNARLGASVFHGTKWYTDAWIKAREQGIKYILLNETVFYEYDPTVVVGEKFVVPEGVEVIASYAFNQSAITQITLPQSIQTILKYAFYKMNNLTAVTSVVANDSEGNRIRSNLQAIEANAFYQLEKLAEIDLYGKSYQSIDNVLYRMSNGLKNTLIVYPTARGAEQFDMEGTYKSYYIVDESVAQIEEGAFFNSSLNVLVFKRGRNNNSLTATTVPSEFATSLGQCFSEVGTKNIRFYVPYHENSGSLTINANYTEGVWDSVYGVLGQDNMLPDAIQVNFESPQKTDGAWNELMYFGFGDVLTQAIPKEAETLTLDGMYTAYNASTSQFEGEPLAADTRAFFDRTVYQKWVAEMQFTDRAGNIVNIVADYNAELTAEQLEQIVIKTEVGKDSQWQGTFPVWLDGVSKLQTILFGNFAGLVVLYGGVYTINDTDIEYKVYFKDPLSQTGDALSHIIVKYNSTIPVDIIDDPLKEGLSFYGWFLGQSGGITNYVSTLIFGNNGTALNVDSLRGYENERDSDNKIPIYLYARWQVTFSFYAATINADGTATPNATVSFTINADYGGSVVAGYPDSYDGFRGYWAVYDENNRLVEVDPSIFLNVTKNKDIYAQYSRMVVEVNFFGKDNNKQTLTTDYGAALKAQPTNPLSYELGGVKYAFEDWYYEQSFATRYHKNDTFRNDVTNIYARFVAEAPNVYVPGGFNSAGLQFEEIGSGIEGNRDFRLYSASRYSDETLFIPDKLINENGQVLGYVTAVGSSAFQNNNVLRHIIFGAQISTINAGAFNGANNLVKLTVDASNGRFSSVDGVLFEANKLLRYPAKNPNTFYSVPVNTNEIASSAFENATNLKSISVVSVNPIRLGSNVFGGIDMGVSSTFIIYVPTNSISSYRANSEWIANIGTNNVARVIVGDSITVSFVNPFNTAQTFSNVNVPLGSSIANPGYVATATGYSFNNVVWCDEFDTPYLFGQPINRSFTLYARMVRVATDDLTYTEVYRVGTNEIEGYAVSIGRSSAKNIVIPNFYKNRPVLKIMENGFSGSTIESLEIPYTLKEVVVGALKNLRQLKSISLAEPGSLRSKNFVVQNGVLYNKDITTILLYPANADNGVTQYKAPASVTAVGDDAFYGNRVLRKVTLGADVLRIGYDAFRLAQIEILSLEALQMVELADGNALLETLSSLVVFVPYENGMLSVYQNQLVGSSWYAYRNKIYATKADIEFRSQVGESTELTLWQSITQETFKTVKEPSYKDPANPFPTRAGKVFRFWKEQQTGARWSFDTDMVKRDMVLVAEWIDATSETLFSDRTPTAGTASLALIDPQQSNIQSIVVPSEFKGKTVTGIALEGFMGMRNLTTVVLPVTLIRIYSSAFKDCISLSSIVFPESVQVIDANAFENCQSLKTIRLPSNMSEIQKEVFKSCTGLTTFDFGKAEITKLHDRAFDGCSSLVSITLPQSLTSIGSETFRGAREIQSVTIPQKVTTVGNGAFSAMTKLGRVVFAGNAVTDIGMDAFNGCSALVSIDLPTSINTIPARMFFGASRLNSIYLGDNIIAIGGSAFEGCSGLTQILGGNALKEIHEFAFANTSISTLTIGENVQMIKQNAFANCLILQSVYIKAVNLQSIGETVFANSERVVIYAETQDIFNNLKTNSNFAVYDKVLKTRYSTLSYTFVDKDGKDVLVERVYLTDQKVSDDDVKQMEIGQPQPSDYYRYTLSHWTYTVTVKEEGKDVTYEYEWKFNQTVLTASMTITARYVISPTVGTSDGLLYRGYAGNTWEISGIGTQINNAIVVVPNYYQGLPVVSIGSGFLSGANSINVLVIPETVTSIKADALRSSSISQIVLVNNDKNKNFKVYDDALYRINPLLPGETNHSVTLMRYPAAKSGVNGVYSLKTPEFEVDGKPVTLSDVGEYAFEFNSIKSFEIAVGDPAGTKYEMFDGVLYNKGKTTLISYPNYKELDTSGTFVIIKSVTAVGKTALSLTAQSEIKKFEVEDTNPVFFADEQGALYRQSGTEYTLVRVPTLFMSSEVLRNRNYEVTTISLKDGTTADVTAIASGAFSNVDLYTITFGHTETAPRLEAADAFFGCQAKILIDNKMYANSSYSGIWNTLILHPRTSYLIFDTSEFLPQALANKHLPAEYSGVKDGFVFAMQTYSQMHGCNLPRELSGLMRMAYSEIEGWYFDKAFTQLAVSVDEFKIIERDTRLYPKWVVSKFATPPTAPPTDSGEPQSEEVVDSLTFVSVQEGGQDVGYYVRFNEKSGIKQLKIIAIPSYHKGLPVVGFDPAVRNTYSGFVNLEMLVIPETFTSLFNIWKVDGVANDQLPKKWRHMVFLPREPIFGWTGNENPTLDTNDLNEFFTAGTSPKYYFADFDTKERFRKTPLWGTSVGIRGKIARSRLTFRVKDPDSTAVIEEFYLNIQTQIETLVDVYGKETDEEGVVIGGGPKPLVVPAGYKFVGWKLDGKLVDPFTMVFETIDNDLYGLILEAAFEKIV